MFRRSFSTAVNMMAAESHIDCSSMGSSNTSSINDKNLAQRILENSVEMGFAARAVKMAQPPTSAHAAHDTSAFFAALQKQGSQGKKAKPTITIQRTPSPFAILDGTQRQQQCTSFIATPDGQRLGVSTGTQSVKSMRKYLRSNNHNDIHGGCDWAVLSCTPTSASFSHNKHTTDPENLQFCIAASQKGSTCATTVCRGSNGSIAYHSHPSIAAVETNYFYARPNDYVLLHSVQSSGTRAAKEQASDAAKAIFQRAIRHAASEQQQRNNSSDRPGANSTRPGSVSKATNSNSNSSSNSITVDVESLAECVLDCLRQHGEDATVVVARMGYIDRLATQPPSTA